MDLHGETVLRRVRYEGGTSKVVRYFPDFLSIVTGVRSGTTIRPPLIKRVKDQTGWRSPTPYSCYYRDIEAWRGSFSEWSVGFEDTHSVSFPYPYGRTIPVDEDLPSVPQSVFNRAVVECLLKIRDERVNVALFLAEATRSASMIAGNLQRFGKALIDMKRGRWASALQHLGIKGHTFKSRSNDFTGRYLELQYGWLPLLKDVYGIYESARIGAITFEPRISAVRTVRYHLPRRYSKSLPYGLTAKYSQGDSRFGVRVHLDYTMNSELLRAASAHGLINPAEVAWELVPFSFLADWVVPVGDWISALSATGGLTFKSGTATTFQKLVRTGHIRHVGSRDKADPGTGVRVGHADLACQIRITNMNRVVLTEDPTPSLYVKNPISFGHIANALALFVQQVSRR